MRYLIPHAARIPLPSSPQSTTTTTPNPSPKLPPHSVEHTITYAKVKKSVLERAQWKPFGQISKEEGTLVTSTEKPIEIRCYPPVVQATVNPEDENNMTTEQLLEQIQIIPRCKMCGMEGHTSLKCPKRKEIHVAQVKPDQPPEFTIFISDISDMTEESELVALVNGHANAIWFRITANEANPPRIPRVKCSMPRDREGNYRGIAYVNILKTPLTEKMVPTLVGLLSGAKLGMAIINAVLQAEGFGDRKKGPNRYDDEDKYGHMAGKRQ